MHNLRARLFGGASWLPLFDNEGGEGGGGGEAAAAAAAAAATAAAAKAKQPETFSREYVTEIREEAKTWRERAQAKDAEIAKAKKDAEDAKMAADKIADDAKKEAKTQTDAAKKAADDRIIMAELRTEAIKAGMVDLDGLKLADVSTVKIKEDGTVEGAEALLTALKTAKPYLFGAARQGFSSQNPPKPGETGKIDATKLKPDEYAAAREKITRR